MSTTRTVGILVFDDVEVLDFAGPFEVFNVTAEMNDPRLLNVYTIGLKDVIKARGDLSINPHYTLETAPKLDILLIPGGFGTRRLMEHDPLLDWIKAQYGEVEHLLSVCTGSLLLGQAGLLNGLQATSHHQALDRLGRISDQITVVDDKRFVDEGKIITSGGIAAGIDMAIYVVQKLWGQEVVEKTIKEMEYLWHRDTSN